MIEIGSYRIDLVETCRFGLDGGAMFGVVPKTLWQRAYAPADDKNRIPMAAKALLIRSAERTILVDTGNSPLMSEKEQEIYGIDFSRYTIDGSLQALGVAQTDITDVILTHLHFDHVGGAVVRSATGDLLPRFPNARHYVQRDHLVWARQPSVKDRASFIPEMYEPLAEHGLLDLIDGPGTLFPGIELLPLHGHTPFMQGVLISEGGSHLFYPADLMPTGAHVPLPYGMAYDNQPLVTIAEKQELHPRMIDEGWTVVFEHDALRQAARVVAGPRGAQLGEEIVITSYAE